MTLVPVTMGLKEELIDQLEIKPVFTIPGLNIVVDETTVVSWIIIAVMFILALILTRNLKVEGEISRRQAVLEMLVDKMRGFFTNIVGEKGKQYVPWLMSVAVFIGAANMVGFFGFKPPTKSMQTALAIALTSIVIVQVAGIRARGVKKHLKSFSQPTWIVCRLTCLSL